MKAYTREEVRERLARERQENRALVLGQAGLGMTAKFIERGGADLLTINAPAYYRMQGLPAITGCFAVTECNELVLSLAKRMRHIVRETPVIAGIYCNQRAYGDMRDYFERVKEAGFSGVMTYPSAAMEEGVFRDYLESASGLHLELECMQRAREAGLYTIGYAMDSDDVRLVAEYGMDALVFDLGFCSADLDMPPEEAIRRINEAEHEAHAINDAMLFLVAGGPIRGAREMERIYAETNAAGMMDGHFALPMVIEEPIREAAASFKELTLR